MSHIFLGVIRTKSEAHSFHINNNKESENVLKIFIATLLSTITMYDEIILI